jgi:hypothetical protein
MLGPIRQLIHNKSVADSALLAISYELATNSVVANPRFSCSDTPNYFTSLPYNKYFDKT